MDNTSDIYNSNEFVEIKEELTFYKNKLNRSKQEHEVIATKLKERVKELNCLYTISKLGEDGELTTDSLMTAVVNLMSPSFQYPEVTCAMVEINSVTYKTKFFKKTEWEISSPINNFDKAIGFLKIYYTSKKPLLDEGPFLKEERYLIDSVCKSVGKILERIKLTRNLKEIEDRYKILTDKFTDGIVITQDNRCQFVNKSFLLMIKHSQPRDLINKEFIHFIAEEFKGIYKESMKIDSETENFQEKLEYQLVSKGTENIWVEEKRNLINWNNAPALLCVIRDISEIKQQEAFSKNEAEQLRKENIRLRSSLKERFRFQNIIGKSEKMQCVYDLILDAANSDANVSIYGESGTGKELVANAIHDLSERKKNFFVPVNCGAIPESLLESEFFGYMKGAFTGATIDKHGYLDLVDKGSLFLDEIGELQLNMQAKLLRAIDGGGYNPIGSNEKRTTDFRIITATNKDLRTEVIKGNMREDFYYRIHVIPITIPPLRERKEDIPYLIEHFSKTYPGEPKHSKIPDIFLERIYTYDWPGNVRELQNALLRFFSTGQFEFLDRMNASTENKEIAHADEGLALEDNLQQQVEEFEKNLILQTLKEHNWHRINVSEKLKVTRNTLYRKMNKYGLTSIHK